MPAPPEQRETMEFDVLIVGAGPAGLAAACRLRQLGAETGKPLSVCVLEKGAEVGAHILSGAVFEPTALAELFPDYAERGAPLDTPVARDEIHYLLDAAKGVRVPAALAPNTMRNRGNFIISLGNLCRWLAGEAEALGAEIYPGFAAAETLHRDDGGVAGVVSVDMGVSASGERRAGYTPGVELRARWTLFAEGCRGHLGKRLIERFALDHGRDPQHYGIGIKELWRAAPERRRPGLVLHTTGWPLSASGTHGGGFLYHAGDGQISVGLVADLSYRNPYLDPFEEFQRFKRHPLIRRHIEGGERTAYGARAITKGGPQSLPAMHFPGGLLIGCDAGTLNYAKIKGSHTAMKSGMIAAETVFAAETTRNGDGALGEHDRAFRRSWAGRELHRQRNFGPAQHKWGNLLGSAYAFVDLNLLGGRAPWTLRDPVPDHERLEPAADCRPIDYPPPDGEISFDRLSSVFLSNTNHEEDQPCHLRLANPETPIAENLPRYDEPARRYCPAGVYEIVEDDEGLRFQINAQNCVHCKTCDIKDPAQNITWVPPESGGPMYPDM